MSVMATCYHSLPFTLPVGGFRTSPKLIFIPTAPVANFPPADFIAGVLFYWWHTHLSVASNRPSRLRYFFQLGCDSAFRPDVNGVYK